MRGTLVALDLETTGLNVETDSIIEIGAVQLQNGEIVAEYSALIDPGFTIPMETTRITGIEQNDLKGAPSLKDVLPQISQFAGDSPVIAHNVAFDIGFMHRFGILKSNLPLDTYELASMLMPGLRQYNLGSLSQQIDVDLENAHRALDDARATALLYWHLWQRALDLPRSLLDEIIQMVKPFNWDTTQFFEAARAEHPGDDDRTIHVAFRGYQRPEIHDTETDPDAGIDSESIRAILSENGTLASQIETYEHRPQQSIMAGEIADALNGHHHLLIEAGTGTGKSLAYLLPAAEWALRTQQRVVISTHTINLQDQLLSQDIPLLQNILDSKLRAAVMKGRSHYLCPRRLEAVRRRRPTNLDEVRILIKILIWVQHDSSGEKNAISLRGAEYAVWDRMSAADEGCTGQRCMEMMHGTCPYHVARQRAQDAHLVIINHALLVKDAQTGDRVLPEYDYVIVDEAHQLEDSITNSLSVRLDRLSLMRRLKDLGGVNSGILGDLLKNARQHIPGKRTVKLEAFIQNIGDVTQMMTGQIQAYYDRVYHYVQETHAGAYRLRVTRDQISTSQFAPVQTIWRSLDEYFDVLIEVLKNLNQALQSFKKYNMPDFDDHLHSISASVEFLTQARHTLNSFSLEPDSGTIYWINIRENIDHISIQTAPLHVGAMMEEYLWRKKESVILTGATLQTAGTFNHLKERLYADNIQSLALGSPFNYRDSTLLYLPENMPEPGRSGYQKSVERGIIALATALDGRVLVLFTSYGQLRETADNITRNLATHNITVYDQATGGNRETLLENFKTTEKAVLLGTRSFWEGVDIPGDDLSALVIARLPFAVPYDPIFASRSETYNDPFHDYAVPDAILRFRQGFGRLIRTQKDRGIVTIFDNRLLNRSYGNRFLDSLPDCTIEYGSLERLPEAARRWLDLDEN